jgi:hypothetical protein
MEPAQLPLRDIHLPPEIGWWPPAIGWWLLVILIPLVIGFGFWIYKLITKKTAVKSAKKQLLQIKQDMQLDNAQKLAQLSMLIRRIAISSSNRNECAGLTGQHWLDYLDRSMKEKSFSQGAGRLLSDAVYRNVKPDDQELTRLISLCEIWFNAQGKKRK